MDSGVSQVLVQELLSHGPTSKIGILVQSCQCPSVRVVGQPPVIPTIILKGQTCYLLK